MRMNHQILKHHKNIVVAGSNVNEKEADPCWEEQDAEHEECKPQERSIECPKGAKKCLYPLLDTAALGLTQVKYHEEGCSCLATAVPTSPEMKPRAC